MGTGITVRQHEPAERVAATLEKVLATWAHLLMPPVVARAAEK